MSRESEIKAIEGEITDTRQRLNELVAIRAQMENGALWIEPNSPLEELGLSVRVLNALKRYTKDYDARDADGNYIYPFRTIRNVVLALDEPNSLWVIRNFGQGSMNHLLTRLRECGYISESYAKKVPKYW